MGVHSVELVTVHWLCYSCLVNQVCVLYSADLSVRMRDAVRYSGYREDDILSVIFSRCTECYCDGTTIILPDEEDDEVDLDLYSTVEPFMHMFWCAYDTLGANRFFTLSRGREEQVTAVMHVKRDPKGEVELVRRSDRVDRLIALMSLSNAKEMAEQAVNVVGTVMRNADDEMEFVYSFSDKNG